MVKKLKELKLTAKDLAEISIYLTTGKLGTIEEIDDVQKRIEFVLSQK